MVQSSQSTTDITEKFCALGERWQQLVLGQPKLLQDMQICLLAGGHLLVEGLPGLGKTRAIHTLANLLGLSYARIQFTPDLLPSDITGSDTLNLADNTLQWRPGPVFNSMLLADEINRAPPKVQSALLEAMQEQQVTTDGQSRPLPEPFFVMATQNPVDHEGTWPLPEAQTDRFLIKTVVDYPSADDELTMVQTLRGNTDNSQASQELTANAVLEAEFIVSAQNEVKQIHVSDSVTDYIVQLAQATRQYQSFAYGVSPRATLALFDTARASAWLDSRDFVTPDDVDDRLISVFSHRLKLSSQALASGQTIDSALTQMSEQVVPS